MLLYIGTAGNLVEEKALWRSKDHDAFEGNDSVNDEPIPEN